MFPLCHIYFANKTINNPSCFAFLGSVCPDIITSEFLRRDITHYNTEDLYKYFRYRGRDMEEFATGAVTHGVDLKGLDYYSDESYPGMNMGYCFEKGRIIENQVVECCNLPDKWGLWKAHNFIEMAFELYVVRHHNWITEKFREIFADDNIIRNVSQELKSYYHISASIFEESFINFSNFFNYSTINESTMMKGYSVQLKEKHGIKNMDIEKAVIQVKRAADIIRPDIDNFFNLTVPRVKQGIETLGGI